MDHRLGVAVGGLQRRAQRGDRLVELAHRDPDLAEPHPDLAGGVAGDGGVGERALGVGEAAGARLAQPELAAQLGELLRVERLARRPDGARILGRGLAGLALPRARQIVGAAGPVLEPQGQSGDRILGFRPQPVEREDHVECHPAVAFPQGLRQLQPQ